MFFVFVFVFLDLTLKPTQLFTTFVDLATFLSLVNLSLGINVIAITKGILCGPSTISICPVLTEWQLFFYGAL